MMQPGALYHDPVTGRVRVFYRPDPAPDRAPPAVSSPERPAWLEECARLGITERATSTRVRALTEAREARMRADAAAGRWSVGGGVRARVEMPALCPRVRNCLVRAGLITRDAVARASDAELLSVRNLGMKGLVEIRRVIPHDPVPPEAGWFARLMAEDAG